MFVFLFFFLNNVDFPAENSTIMQKTLPASDNQRQVSICIVHIMHIRISFLHAMNFLGNFEFVLGTQGHVLECTSPSLLSIYYLC